MPTVRLHAKILTAPNVSIATAEQRMRDLYASVGITVQLVSTENLNLPLLNDVDVGQPPNTCLRGQTTAEQNQLFANRNNAGTNDVVVYFVRSTVPPLQRLCCLSSGPSRCGGRAGQRRSGPWHMRSATCSVLSMSTTMTGS